MQTGRFLSANSSLGRAPTRRRRANTSRKCLEVTYRGDLKEKALVFLQPPATHSASKTPDQPSLEQGGRGWSSSFTRQEKGNLQRSTSETSSCVGHSSTKHLLSAYCVPAKHFSTSLGFSSILNSPLLPGAQRASL